MSYGTQGIISVRPFVWEKDPCASEEGMKELRALQVRVPGPGRALARDGHSFVHSLVRSYGRKFSHVL